jgi:nucleotide-binding universal stress UspA family protein
MYQTILVHVSTDPGAGSRIRYAVDLAHRFDAKLVGVAAVMPHASVAEITAGVADARFFRLECDRIAEHFKLAEQQFRRIAAHSGVDIEWRSLEQFPTIALATVACAADLVVISRGARGLVNDDHHLVDPGDLLMSAGRPVLISPPRGGLLEARNVVVAWKNAREARRALADALPFLIRADRVNLLEVRESEPSTVAEAAAFLAAHRVNYRIESIERQRMNIEDQLMSFADRANADLIVAGGYGHSRIRELIFGGVTRSLLARCPVSCLFSH